MNYQHMGMAALIPGMQFMLDRMQTELDEFRKLLAGAQQEGSKPPNDLDEYLFRRKSKSSKGYWSKFTPEERSAEMKRRAKVSMQKRLVNAPQTGEDEIDIESLHPRDARSPRHAAWVKKLTRVQRRVWSNLSEEERQKRIDGMLATRAQTVKKQHINGRAN